jgi:protein TonB
MKKLITPALLLAFAGFVNAQTPDNVDYPPPPDKTTVEEEKSEGPQVFTAVEQMPTFPGGDDGMLKFLSKNIHYPTLARDCGCQGTVYVTFVIIEDGSIINAQILRPVRGCDDFTNGNKKEDKDNGCKNASKALSEESLKVINNMPKWVPGMQNGKPVRVQYNLPVKFTLR